MMLETVGTFHSATAKTIPKKDGTGNFIAGQAVFEIDNSWTGKDGTLHPVKTLFPFKVFGATATLCQTLKIGELCKISFQLEGREWQDKRFGDCKAVFVNKVGDALQGASKDEDIPF